jgi:arylsulfatase A
MSSRLSMKHNTPLLSLFAAIILVVCSTNILSAAERPNFVIIMADDLGYGDLSSYGGWIETPNIDRLAEEGLRFTDYHSAGNVCSPTRAALMTGCYQQRTGISGVVYADPAREEHKHGLQVSEVTFAEMLNEAGYATALFGKWHLGYERQYNPVHHGFEEFKGYVSGNVDFISHVDQAGTYDWWHDLELVVEEGYSTHLITEHGLRFIEENKDESFCLYLPHEAPHYPYQAPNDPAIRTAGVKGSNRALERTDVQEAYREMVVEVDHGVGQIVELLEELELDEKTLVLFLSDNGACQRGDNGPLRGFKGSNWEGGHRVPCIAWMPGYVEPGETDQPSITFDIMPTLLSMANIPIPGTVWLDGESWEPLLKTGQACCGPRELYWNGKAMRDGDWKLILNGKGATNEAELYYLADDIGEEHDLAAEHPDRVQTMRTMIELWIEDVEDGATEQP